jgi:hypothetical protein
VSCLSKLSNAARHGAPFLMVIGCQAASAADLLSFCLGPAPTDATLTVYNAQCPAYLQGQFASANGAVQSATLNTQLSQQQTQAAILAAYAGMIKPPSPQIPSGVDVSALAIAALKKDAETTFQVGTAIGKKIGPLLTADHQALMITPADLAALLQTPVEATGVKEGLADYTGKLDQLQCSGAAGPKAAVIPATAGVLGVEALLSSIATGISMFQPTLLATAKTTGVSDPQYLIAAGVASGVGDARRPFLHSHAPSTSTDNAVLQALGQLKLAVTGANQRMAACKPTDPVLKESAALISDAKDFVSALVKTDGSKPSLLDSAARRSAMTDAKITHTLLLTRDVSGGGVAAVKPNWFLSTTLLMASASGVTYQLTDLDGVIKVAGIEFAEWSDRCGISTWPKAFESCSNK